MTIAVTHNECSVADCGGKVVGFGFCMKHYRRFKRSGHTGLAGTAPGNVETWLREHVGHDADDCLTFPFSRSEKGYGRVNFGGFRSAHRWMCEAANGPPPVGKPFALHSCGRGTDGCVNPRHLYWGSSADNYQDQVRHGVAAIGERMGKATLSEAKVRLIRKLSAEGKTKSQIAHAVEAHPDCVRSVLRGRTWRHVA